MLRFPVARLAAAPSFSPAPPSPLEDRLTDAELRAEGLLRAAAQAVSPGQVEVDEVVARLGQRDRPLFDVSLMLRDLDGDEPCVSLCRLLSQLLASLNLHLEGAGR
jgi:hypothetical protein